MSHRVLHVVISDCRKLERGIGVLSIGVLSTSRFLKIGELVEKLKAVGRSVCHRQYDCSAFSEEKKVG
jgi:hypothetical protein